MDTLLLWIVIIAVAAVTWSVWRTPADQADNTVLGWVAKIRKWIRSKLGGTP